MAEFGFPKSSRLLRPAQFDRVFQRRCSFADELIVVYFAPSECDRPRLGLAVSRKCGNAVVRNRWKRALREAFRLVQQDLASDLDLVVLPRRGARPNATRLQSSFKQLALRAADKLALRAAEKLALRAAGKSALRADGELASSEVKEHGPKESRE